MNNKQTLNNFLENIKIWEQELPNYEFSDLLKQEDNANWSLGQVYMHLINGTLSFHLKQLELCIHSSENKHLKKNFKGFLSYKLLKGIPPIKIKVPPTPAYTPKQPENIGEITNGLSVLKEKMTNALQLFKEDQKGKTEHPGFGFLNAEEWYKLIEMHFLHHLRQKKRIDSYLQNS